MPVSPISPKILSQLILFIKMHVQEDQLEKGYQLFRQPDIVEWLPADNNSMTAFCEEANFTFRVQLSPDATVPMTCSCGEEAACRHGLAVFLHLLRLAGRSPEMFLAECNTAVKARMRREKTPTLDALTGHSPAVKVKEAKSPDPAALPVLPGPGDFTQIWRDYFQLRHGQALAIPQPSTRTFGYSPPSSVDHSGLESFYEQLMKEMAALSGKWPETARGLFLLHAQLYAMERMDIYISRLSTDSYMAYVLNQTIARWGKASSDKLGLIIRSINIQEARSKYESAYREAVDILHRNTFKERYSLLDWPSLYRIIWSRVFRYSDLIDEERGRLDRLMPAARDAQLKNSIYSSRALLDFMQGDDLAALSNLKKRTSLPTYEFNIYLEQLGHGQLWSRLLLWLQKLDTTLKRDVYYLENVLFPFWLKAVAAQPEEPAWRSWMESMLPQSRGVYSAFLIRSGEGRRVAGMYLSEGYPVYYMDREILKLLEKEDIRLVLPLYHQDVERHVLEKNRNSYKEAVRLLKKLAVFYRKLKEQERWQAYLEQLAARFSRYRAFQEELRKGKLIV